ncbi:MAG: hypothetical protein DHS20C18_44640 [Saprospiraceae bacterium]|nr:MAG: hypothetical protein DHS20C18_44640 [Saprospiraceae bacterium]
MKYEVELKSLKNDFPKKNYYLVKNLRVKFFQEYDNLLDKMLQGPTFLKIPEIANLVQENLQTFDEELYDLIAYCIMPNHVHLLIDTSIQFPKIWNGENLEQLKITPLMQIMKRIKGPTAVYANRFLNKSGKFWHRESYDRLIRDKKELNNTIAYILENPVKARLVKNWQDWPFSFYKYS